MTDMRYTCWLYSREYDAVRDVSFRAEMSSEDAGGAEHPSAQPQNTHIAAMNGDPSNYDFIDVTNVFIHAASGKVSYVLEYAVFTFFSIRDGPRRYVFHGGIRTS